MINRKVNWMKVALVQITHKLTNGPIDELMHINANSTNSKSMTID